jgi:hypothetical protein
MAEAQEFCKCRSSIALAFLLLSLFSLFLTLFRLFLTLFGLFLTLFSLFLTLFRLQKKFLVIGGAVMGH